ncbi:MAG: alpha-L-fucosidase [Clostridia bacterium]
MAFSILEKDLVKRDDWFLYQPFTAEEWNKYPFATEQDLQWFRDAKFGLFLHVGLSAMGKVDLSWPRYTRVAPDVGHGWVPDKIYDGWAKKIKFAKFNATEWAKIAKESGFKYVVIITKHMEGFHMWDTQFSDYKITNSPFGRDYLKEMVDAFRKEGLKIGLYFSKRECKHPDYEPIDTTKVDVFADPPRWKLKEGCVFERTEKQKRYIKYLFNATQELMTNYGVIDMLWWDASWFGGMFTADMWDSEELEKHIRKLQPHILINNRSSLVGDFDTPECSVGAFQNTRPWESCMCIGKSWSWTGGKPKKFDLLLSQLVNCVCGDGNYLLSTGCMPNGALGKRDIKRMKEFGAWLAKYGESVYCTRGGIWQAKEGLLSCFKDNIIYLHILKEYQGKDIKVDLKGNRIKSYSVLTGENITIKYDESKLYINASDDKNFDIIVKLVCEKPINS